MATGSSSASSTQATAFTDYWSSPTNLITVTSVAADLNFPDIVVSGLPYGALFRRVVLIMTCRAIRDTSGANNYINAANKALRVKISNGAWGQSDIIALILAQNSLYCVATVKEPGLPLVGNIDIKSVISGNGTYNVRSDQTYRADAILAAGNNLELYDVQVGFRVFYY